MTIFQGRVFFKWWMDSPFWNEILLLFFRAISLTSCFPPQQQSTQWVSQRYRPLSGLVFIYLFIHFWIPSVYWLYYHSLLSFVFQTLSLSLLFQTFLWNTYLAFFSCSLLFVILAFFLWVHFLLPAPRSTAVALLWLNIGPERKGS